MVIVSSVTFNSDAIAIRKAGLDNVSSFGGVKSSRDATAPRTCSYSTSKYLYSSPKVRLRRLLADRYLITTIVQPPMNLSLNT